MHYAHLFAILINIFEKSCHNSYRHILTPCAYLISQITLQHIIYVYLRLPQLLTEIFELRIYWAHSLSNALSRKWNMKISLNVCTIATYELTSAPQRDKRGLNIINISRPVLWRTKKKKQKNQFLTNFNFLKKLKKKKIFFCQKFSPFFATIFCEFRRKTQK